MITSQAPVSALLLSQEVLPEAAREKPESLSLTGASQDLDQLPPSSPLSLNYMSTGCSLCLDLLSPDACISAPLSPPEGPSVPRPPPCSFLSFCMTFLWSTHHYHISLFDIYIFIYFIFLYPPLMSPLSLANNAPAFPEALKQIPASGPLHFLSQDPPGL